MTFLIQSAPKVAKMKTSLSFDIVFAGISPRNLMSCFVWCIAFQKSSRSLKLNKCFPRAASFLSHVVIMEANSPFIVSPKRIRVRQTFFNEQSSNSFGNVPKSLPCISFTRRGLLFLTKLEF